MTQRLNPHAPLNARQRRVRDYIHTFHREQRRMPSRREVARGLERPDGGYLGRVVDKLRVRGELPR